MIGFRPDDELWLSSIKWSCSSVRTSFWIGLQTSTKDETLDALLMAEESLKPGRYKKGWPGKKKKKKKRKKRNASVMQRRGSKTALLLFRITYRRNLASNFIHDAMAL